MSEADETPFSRLSEIYVDLHKFLEAKDSKVCFECCSRVYYVGTVYYVLIIIGATKINSSAKRWLQLVKIHELIKGCLNWGIA